MEPGKTAGMTPHTTDGPQDDGRTRKAEDSFFYLPSGAAQWLGDPELTSILVEYRQIYESLLRAGQCDHQCLIECYCYLVSAEAAHDTWPFPYKRIDLAREHTISLLCCFCRILPPERLLIPISFVKAGVEYLPEKSRGIVEGQIAGVQKHVIKGNVDEKLRRELESLVREVGWRRQRPWMKANRLRQRLLNGALVAVVILGAVGALLAIFIKKELLPTKLWGAPGWLFFVLLPLLGALGGLLSGARARESFWAPKYTYYIERTLVCIRPIIGAVAGLISYFILLLALPEVSFPLAIVSSFASGFSERFFLSSLERVIGESEAKPADHLPE